MMEDKYTVVAIISDYPNTPLSNHGKRIDQLRLLSVLWGQ